MPDIVTVSSKLTITDPTFPVTAIVDVVILEPPSINNVSVERFKDSAVFKSPLYVNVLALDAASTYSVVAIKVELLRGACVTPVVAVFIVPSKSPANVAPVYVPVIVTLGVKAIAKP